MLDLRQRLRGEVIDADDARYDITRALYNGMIDKKPRTIIRCTSAADVINAVAYGRETGLPIAIRGGGHNGAGFASCDDGLMIDISPMKGVRVDPATCTVTAEPGCTQGDVDQATHPFGLAVPAGIVSSTGIGGLTLGGGHGYLTRQHGLTIDNLLEVDVVLADGRLVTADPEERPDLFWAVRGGGGNFGVVTRFLFRAHLVDTVFAGPIFFDIAHAREVMAWYRDFLPRAAPRFSPFLGLKRVPSVPPFPTEIRGRQSCVLVCCYDGPEDEVREAMRPIRDELPTPLLDGCTQMPYPALQSMFDPLLPPGLQWYWKGDVVKELPDAAIDAHLEHSARAPGEKSLMHLYPIDGAVHDVDPADTAWQFRDATWSMVIAAIDPDPRLAEPLTRWARAYWEAIHPFTVGGAYVNFMMDEGPDRVRATYGDNYARLLQVKSAYDPSNLFHVNQNIQG